MTHVYNAAGSFLFLCQVVSVALRIQTRVSYQNLAWNVLSDSFWRKSAFGQFYTIYLQPSSCATSYLGGI